MPLPELHTPHERFLLTSLCFRHRPTGEAGGAGGRQASASKGQAESEEGKTLHRRRSAGRRGESGADEVISQSSFLFSTALKLVRGQPYESLCNSRHKQTVSKAILDPVL